MARGGRKPKTTSSHIGSAKEISLDQRVQGAVLHSMEIQPKTRAQFLDKIT